MPAMTKFNSFVQDLGTGAHNLSTGVLKAALTNTLPVVTNTVLANITQLGTGGGYTGGADGGYTLDSSTWTNSSGTSKLVIADEVITASGASVGPFQYIVIYNSSTTSPVDALIGWYNYGSAITLADTETLTLDFDGTNGVLTLV